MKSVSLAAAAIAMTLTAGAAAQAAEVTVFITSAARRAYDALAPQFERTTGHKLVTHSSLPLELVKRADAGEPFDVLILSYDVEPLIKQGKLAPGSRTVFGQIGVSVAVPAGKPKPDFSTVDAFKRSLLSANAIATSGEGSSGRYVAALLDRLGIADQVKPKIKSGRAGTTALLVSRAEVDFAVTGLPPLLGTPNIEWLGYLPAEINSWLPFSGGVNVKAKEPDAARVAELPDVPGRHCGLEGERPGAGQAVSGCTRPAKLSPNCHVGRTKVRSPTGQLP